MDDLLNQSQKDWLAIVLRSAEEVMVLVRRLVDYEEEGLLHALSNDLSSKEIEKLRKLSREVDQLVAELDKRFHFDREQKKISRILRGQLATLWVALEESRSRKLSRSGEVDPRLSSQLDPHIERLIDIVLGMEHIVSHASDQAAEE
jgi:hypothetical protein